MSFTEETKYWQGTRRLSPRQLEILREASLGLSNPEIADRLGIGTHTVKRHMQWVTHKLDARNRAHAVAIAFDKGLLR